MIKSLRLVNKIGQIAYGPSAAVGGFSVVFGQWTAVILPGLWFLGIIVSQIVYGRCVILEAISRLKKKLPKAEKPHDYLFKAYNPKPVKIKGLEVLNPYEVEDLKKTHICHVVRRRHPSGSLHG